MKTSLVFFGIALVLVSAVAVVGIAGQGAADIKIDGGSRGDVPFPHHAHQDRLKDCSVCHAAFPQEAGGINKMKDAGQLTKKQVMNKQCVKCHKEEKKAGNPTGPTTCSKCHVK